MTPATLSRISVLEDALAIEQAGGDWSLRHLLAVLGCSRATLYRNARLMDIRIDQVGGAVWPPSGVRLYQASRIGAKRRAPRRTR
jgi:hypothetical protein